MNPDYSTFERGLIDAITKKYIDIRFKIETERCNE